MTISALLSLSLHSSLQPGKQRGQGGRGVARGRVRYENRSMKACMRRDVFIDTLRVIRLNATKLQYINFARAAEEVTTERVTLRAIRGEKEMKRAKEKDGRTKETGCNVGVRFKG